MNQKSQSSKSNLVKKRKMKNHMTKQKRMMASALTKMVQNGGKTKKASGGTAKKDGKIGRFGKNNSHRRSFHRAIVTHSTEAVSWSMSSGVMHLSCKKVQIHALAVLP